MKYTDLVEKISHLLYFTPSIVYKLFPNESTSDINTRLSKLAKKDLFIRIKRDRYITLERFNEAKKDIEMLSVIASQLREPSYLSLDFVLRKYNILTEATYGITLVSTKTKLVIKNKLGEFTFKQISPKLFTGYNTHNHQEYKYFEASMAKALFDWLYLRKSIIPRQKELNLVEELRLNLHSFTQKDWNELKSYGKISNNKSLVYIINNLYNNAHNSK